MHDRARRIDDPAMLVELDDLERVEQTFQSRDAFGVQLGRRIPIRLEVAVMGEQGRYRVDILGASRRIGLIEYGADRRTRVHG